ncbi:MAG: YggT family protein [Deltaproteobacteria bacterium]|nr:YggT family protein [Deltaproteobacteria bacterium]
MFLIQAIKAIIDILIVIVLLRLLIRPVEANFNTIYNLIFRITDPILKPFKTIVKNDFYCVCLSVLCLVIIRGLIYFSTGRISLLSGEGASILNLFQLLFQFYMVVWFIAILTGDRVHTPVIGMLQRAFLPLGSLAARLNIQRKSFSLFSFVVIFIIYSLISYLLHNITSFKSPPLSFKFYYGIVEALVLIIELFPGFFSLVILVSVLLSWVSPSPYNPVVQTIYGISEPLLAPFRRIIPPIAGLDLSPIAALLCFQIIGGVLRQTIINAVGKLI